ncbi:MAG: hypothetical protein RLZZ613_1652, partial [Pseudomonadota bacterium]
MSKILESIMAVKAKEVEQGLLQTPLSLMEEAAQRRLQVDRPRGFARAMNARVK